jgi:peptidoglycan lytic transglycosylase D
MKLLRILVWAMAGVTVLLTTQFSCFAQTKLYQNMNASERAKFVSEKSKALGRQISETEYQLTPSFETEIQGSLDMYVQRLTDSDKDADARLIIERSQSQAPLIMTSFKARGVSPLIGLYLAWIESEFVNLSTPNKAGAIGMFQFLPGTGMKFGLTPDELLDVGKSADAAAQYVAKSMNLFRNDRMKEVLAILAYNRGEKNVKDDLARALNPTDKACTVCALSAQHAKPNQPPKDDSDYVARFFAAAIFGENPQAFGLSTPPISSFGTGN